jgi:hypothetical protein
MIFEETERERESGSRRGRQHNKYFASNEKKSEKTTATISTITTTNKWRHVYHKTATHCC